MNKVIKTLGLVGTAAACTAIAYAKNDKVRKNVDSVLDKAASKLHNMQAKAESKQEEEI